MPKWTSLMLVLIVGCGGAPKAPVKTYQRFVLVPNPAEINKTIPVGALALDTQTGELCYTVGGDYTSSFPSIEMCSVVLRANP